VYRAAELLVVPPLKLWFNWHMEGLERVPREGPALVAANHISYLDPLAHGHFLVRAGRRPRFLAKSELFEVRVLGTVLRLGKQIPVKRGTGDRSSLAAATGALRAGEAVIVYPEGTVTTDPAFNPMRGKTGVVRLALATGTPILPLAVWGSQHVWQKSGKGSLKFGRPIWLATGRPIDLSAHAAQADDPVVLRKLADEVIDELAGLVGDLRRRYPSRWA
jgi:1-acyl-sn-glycerol-3-phosphate acyltransferase